MGKEDTFLKDTIFADDQEYYAKLKQLHAQKQELQKLKSLCTLSKPFVIEFSGTPRTGKTTTIQNLYDFFKKGGFKVELIEEFTTSKYYKEEFKKKYDSTSMGDLNLAIAEEVYHQLKQAIETGKDIILIDRSLNDRQIWNYRRFICGDMSAEKYYEATEKYSKLSKELIDFLVVTYADSLVSLKRDYVSSLALEKRNFLNQKNIEEYNQSLNGLRELFQKSVDDSIFIDTSNITMNDVSEKVAHQVLPAMRKKYIKTLNKTYHTVTQVPTK